MFLNKELEFYLFLEYKFYNFFNVRYKEGKIFGKYGEMI